MSLQFAVISGLILYFFAMMWVAYSSKKGETQNDFVIGSRKVGIIPTMASIASGIRDGSGIVLWVGMGYMLGYAGVFWLAFGYAIGSLFLFIYGPKLNNIAKKNNYITVGQMIKGFVGEKSKKAISVIILLVCILAISMQLFVSGNLLSNIMNIAPVFGVLFAAGIVGIYLTSGGYKAVVKTDTIQFFIILSLILIPFFIHPAVSDITNLKTIFAFGVADKIAIFMMGLLLSISCADIWQRIFSAKNKKTIRTAVALVPVVLLIMTLGLTFLGMGAKQLFTTTDMNGVFFTLFLQQQVSVYILAYLAIICMAITMSTLDTYTYLFSSTVLEDFTKFNIEKDKKTYIKLSKWIMAVILILGSIAALFISNLIQFAFSVMSLVYIFAPIFIFSGIGLFNRTKRLDTAMSINIIINIIIYGCLFASGIFAQTIYTIIPAGTSLLGCLICLAFFNKKESLAIKK